MKEVKPGIKTTELWVSVINGIVNLAMAYGALNAEQAEAWAQLGGALAFAAAASLPLAVYVWSRAKVKAENGAG